MIPGMERGRSLRKMVLVVVGRGTNINTCSLFALLALYPSYSLFSAAADFTHSPPSTLPPTSYLLASVSAASSLRVFKNWGQTLRNITRMEHVEAVIMRGGQPRFGGLRSTLCISSQVGCKMGYKFCATGSLGFKNNLPLEEIVEQLVHASHLSQIHNVVFMIAASPQTCAANIGKGCGDDWEGEFFPGIPKIKYESPSSKSPFAFKWYNAEEEILGKKMSVFPFSLLSLSHPSHNYSCFSSFSGGVCFLEKFLASYYLTC